MTELCDVQQFQKLSRIWSRRRERHVEVRIYYDLREQDGCRIYLVSRVEELN